MTLSMHLWDYQGTSCSFLYTDHQAPSGQKATWSPIKFNADSVNTDVKRRNVFLPKVI